MSFVFEFFLAGMFWWENFVRGNFGRKFIFRNILGVKNQYFILLTYFFPNRGKMITKN